MKKIAIALGLSALAVVAVAGVSSDATTAPAAASEKKPAPADKTEVVPINEDVRKPPARKVAAKGPSLRCWQYGRLILDEPVSEVPPSIVGSGHKFEGAGGNLQLLDMHSSSCLIK